MVDTTPFLCHRCKVRLLSRGLTAAGCPQRGGLLALREIERRIGVVDRLAACLKGPRAPERVQHRLAEIIRFRMIAAGYEDGNDAEALRRDPDVQAGAGPVALGYSSTPRDCARSRSAPVSSS